MTHPTHSAEDARIYLVTPSRVDPERFASVLTDVLSQVPVACVRLDLGQAPEDDWVRAANYLIEPCHAADVALVVTDHYRLVDRLGLDGVHLDASRTPIREVRKALGPDRIVGAWAGTSRHQGMVLAEAGADYVCLGPVGDTGALGDDTRADDELFAWWAEMIETPCVAEGGVSLSDAERLTTSADFIVPDIREATDARSLIASLQAYQRALSG